MSTHTDRIRQMAQEAGIQSPEQYDGHSQDCPWMATTDELTRFAQLVAEDCASTSPNGLDIRASAGPAEVWTKFRDAIRARYRLKD